MSESVHHSKSGEDKEDSCRDGGDVEVIAIGAAQYIRDGQVLPGHPTAFTTTGGARHRPGREYKETTSCKQVGI
eukprot:CAMPEP_0115155474 /NCGR_PEP_ID=MMETSP0227-20121206/67907_1 /TAXON_ID=89957 /ORGANISM="Polarella glacialis, Strain CCMP 1383" /LENGTH=73 /DNA_ID=CAMNT_0002566539 /DNA_START=126 /DNA_END=344 /DNA_ORIENTATION=+